MGACGLLFVVQAAVRLDLPAEALGDGLDSELWAVACPSDWELGAEELVWRESGGREMGVEAPARFPACNGRGPHLREGGASPHSGSRPCHHALTSSQAARKSSGDRHSLLGCGS